MFVPRLQNSPLFRPTSLVLTTALHTAACQPQEIPLDRPPQFPDDAATGSSDTTATDGSTGDETSGPPDLPDCEPTPCAGLLDKTRGDEGTGLCISFEETQQQVYLNSNGALNGISVTDYNKDGYPDVFLLRNGAPNRLFRNDGGMFQTSTLTTGLNFGGDTQAAIWGDHDYDGDVDLLLVTDAGSDLYENQNGTYELLPDNLGIHDPNPGKTAAFLKGGILIATENGTRFYERLFSDSFTESTLAYGLDDPGDGVAIAVADYDGDGLEDIYLANSTGYNRLFRQLVNESYDSVEDETGTVGSGNSTDVVSFYHNGQDKPDFYVTNYGEAQPSPRNDFFVNQQDGTFIESAQLFGLQDPGNTTQVAVADALGDGLPVVFLGRWEQQNLLYLPVLDDNGDVTHYLDIAHPLGMDINGQTIGAEWLDYDQDGLPDLLVAMANGALHLYHNTTHEVELCPEEDG